MAYDKATKAKARKLYEQGAPFPDIAATMGISERSLRTWFKGTSTDGIEEQIASLVKKTPTEAVTRKIAMLTKSAERLKRINKKPPSKKPVKAGQLIIMAQETARLKALMMQEEYGLYPYQRVFLSDESRFRVWLKSRQIGATYGCSGECLADAMGGLDQLIISASEEQALKWQSEIQKHAEKLNITLGGSTTKITTPVGTVIYIFANNFRTIQGFSGSVWLDEFAWYLNCKRIWEAFLPSITSVKAGDTKARVTILSTPFEEGGYFHKLIVDTEKYFMFTRHLTTIHDAVCDGLDVDVELLRALFDADSWAMMYECQFVDDESALLPISLIKSCVNDKLKLEASSGECLRAGYDIGRKKDLSVLVSLAKRGDKLVVSHLDTLRKASFDAQKAVLCAFLDTHPDSMIRIDATGIGANLAENIRSRYKKRAVEVIFTAPSKEQMALNLKKAFEDSRLEIPNDPLLIADLHSIKRKAGTRGFLYDADRNKDGHADRFWALALAAGFDDFIGRRKSFCYSAAIKALEMRKEALEKLKNIKDRRRNAKA